MEDSPEDGRWGSVAAAPGLGGGRRRSVETPIGQVGIGRAASCSVGVGDVGRPVTDDSSVTGPKIMPDRDRLISIRLELRPVTDDYFSISQ
uniref:Uncharacterized protein n=1 Tax=Oryza glaberrima TaxID=4538 RepID=I1QTA4_ORYGL